MIHPKTLSAGLIVPEDGGTALRDLTLWTGYVFLNSHKWWCLIFFADFSQYFNQKFGSRALAWQIEPGGIRRKRVQMVNP